MSVKKKVEKHVAEMRHDKTKETMSTQTYQELPKAKLHVRDYAAIGFEELDANHKNINSSQSGTGCITVINHERCGRRIHISSKIWRELGTPRYIKLLLSGGDLIVMEGTEQNVAVRFDRSMDFEHAVKHYNGKIVLYASKTAVRLTEEWGLKTDKGCCFTGGEYVVCTIGEKKAVAIIFREPEEVNVEEEVEVEGSSSDVTENNEENSIE